MVTMERRSISNFSKRKRQTSVDSIILVFLVTGSVIIYLNMFVNLFKLYKIKEN